MEFLILQVWKCCKNIFFYLLKKFLKNTLALAKYKIQTHYKP